MSSRSIIKSVGCSVDKVISIVCKIRIGCGAITRGCETSGIKFEFDPDSNAKDTLLVLVELLLSESPSTSLSRGVIHVAYTMWHLLLRTSGCKGPMLWFNVTVDRMRCHCLFSLEPVLDRFNGCEEECLIQDQAKHS
jgi:hypothetical protein